MMEMKILFFGTTKSNSGPSNVNNGIIRNFTASFWSVNSNNKYNQMIEALLKALVSNVVVVSGISKQGKILTKFAKFLKKRVVLIMHGCVAYEAVVNKQENCEAMVAQEKYLMEKADLLLPVSRKFRNWICERYPQYADKTKYLYNGVDKKMLEISSTDGERVRGSVAVTGADRGVKNNGIVSRAVESMAGKASLTVYGTVYHEIPTEFEHTTYAGMISHADYIRRLQETELFVVNSIFESFSISAIEAVCCGCSVLISDIVGATDLLTLEESDIIHDPMNVQELREKIEYLLEHPNHERILASLDLDEYSYENSVKRLEQMCRELIAQ